MLQKSLRDTSKQAERAINCVVQKMPLAVVEIDPFSLIIFLISVSTTRHFFLLCIANVHDILINTLCVCVQCLYGIIFARHVCLEPDIFPSSPLLERR